MYISEVQQLPTFLIPLQGRDVTLKRKHSNTIFAASLGFKNDMF